MVIASENYLTISSRHDPIVLLIFGHNCAGKSTVGSMLAAELPFSAFIEVDELHRKIRNGRVAWSGGASPLELPDEYRRQRKLAEDNAVRLALAFLEAGFNCVIDNLTEAFASDATWAAQAFHGCPAFRLQLCCDDTTLEERLRLRHGSSYRSDLAKSAKPLGPHSESFDWIVDTSNQNPRSVAASIVASLSLSVAYGGTSSGRGRDSAHTDAHVRRNSICVA